MQSEEEIESLLEEGTGNGVEEYTVRDQYLVRLGYCPLRFTEEPELVFHDGIVDSFFPSGERKWELPILDPRLSPKSPVFAQRDLGEKPQPELPEERTFIENFKHVFREGGTFSSVFNLCSATLGAGALSIPYVFSKAGIVLGALLILFGAITTVFSIKLLLRSREISRLSTYEDLAMFCFGRKGAIFVELNIIIFCFGTCVAYTVALADVIHPIISQFFSHPVLSSRYVVILVFVLLVILPLSFLESIGSMRFANMLGVASIVVLIVTIVAKSVMHMAHSGLPSLPAFRYVNLSWEILSSISIVMFAFTSQINVFSIYTELHRPCIRRMKRVVNRGVAISGALYLFIGVFAFLENLDKTAPDILYNYSAADPAMGIAEFAVGLSLALGYPLSIFPCRNTIEMLLFSSKEPSKFRFIVVTVVLVFLATLLAIFVPAIDSVFSLLGSVCSSIICYILPSLFYIRIKEGSIFGMDKIGAVMLLLVGATVGVLSTVTASSEFFH